MDEIRVGDYRIFSSTLCSNRTANVCRIVRIRDLMAILKVVNCDCFSCQFVYYYYLDRTKEESIPLNKDLGDVIYGQT